MVRTVTKFRELNEALTPPAPEREETGKAPSGPEDEIAPGISAPRTHDIGGWRGIYMTDANGKPYLELNPLKTWYANMDRIGDRAEKFLKRFEPYIENMLMSDEQKAAKLQSHLAQQEQPQRDSPTRYTPPREQPRRHNPMPPQEEDGDNDAAQRAVHSLFNHLNQAPKEVRHAPRSSPPQHNVSPQQSHHMAQTRGEPVARPRPQVQPTQQPQEPVIRAQDHDRVREHDAPEESDDAPEESDDAPEESDNAPEESDDGSSEEEFVHSGDEEDESTPTDYSFLRKPLVIAEPNQNPSLVHTNGGVSYLIATDIRVAIITRLL